IAVPNARSGSAVIIVPSDGGTFDIPGIGSAFDVSSADSYGTGGASS
ncbi:319_t:CDS:1, partial [Funneliformis caledonium]